MGNRPRSAQRRFVGRVSGTRFVLRNGRFIDTKRNEVSPWDFGPWEQKQTVPRRPSPQRPDERRESDLAIFGPDGFSYDRRTESLLAERTAPWLFVIDGRLREAAFPTVVSQEPADWERVLAGWERPADEERFVRREIPTDPAKLDGPCASDDAPWAQRRRKRRTISGLQGQAQDDDEPRAPWVFRGSDARWRSSLRSRLATLFDRDPADPTVLWLADFLITGRDADQGPAGDAHAAFWGVLDAHPFRRKCFDLLRATCFRRRQIIHSQEAAKRPAVFEITFRRRRYKFVVQKRHPRESEAVHRKAVSALRLLADAEFASRRRMLTPHLMAATLWKAQRFMVEPKTGRGQRSLHDICREIRVEARRVSRLVLRLQRREPLTVEGFRRLIQGREGRQPGWIREKEQEAVLLSSAPGLPDDELPRYPEGRRALRKFEEAARLKYGPIVAPGAPEPTPTSTRRAEHLRREGLVEMRKLRLRLARQLAAGRQTVQKPLA